MSPTLPNAKEARSFVFSSGKKQIEREEFERIALPNFSRLFSAAFYFTKNEALAEELVQETYLRAFRFFDKFERGTNCRAWLLSIMRNIFINRYRQKKLEPEMIDWEAIDQTYESIIDEHSHPGNSPEEILFSHVMDVEVEQALQGLPEDFRTAIILVDIQELNYEEAAQVMGCPVGTIRSRLSRGRRLLQVALRDFALQRGLVKRGSVDK